MAPRRSSQRARRAAGPPAWATELAPGAGFWALNPAVAATLVGADLDSLLLDLEIDRVASRALGVTDPVVVEVRALASGTIGAFPGPSQRCATIARGSARTELPATATAAEVDAAAIRLLREWAGLGHVRWPPTPPNAPR